MNITDQINELLNARKAETPVPGSIEWDEYIERQADLYGDTHGAVALETALIEAVRAMANGDAALRIALRRMLENDYCRMRKNAKALVEILNALKGA